MRTLCATLIFFAANLLTGYSDSSPSVTAFNSDWRYRSGANDDARFPETDDSNWRRLSFPHELEPSSVRFQWYRKHFKIPDSARDHRVFIQIDGVKGAISVWLNGHFLGARTAGTKSVELDLSDRLKFDAELENVLVLRLDAPTNGPHSASLKTIDATPDVEG